MFKDRYAVITNAWTTVAAHVPSCPAHSPLCSLPIMLSLSTHSIPLLLLSVLAAVGLGNGQSAGREAQAVLVAARVGDTGVDPDTPRLADAAGAGKETLALEGEVAVLVNLPSLVLAVLGLGIASAVAKDALAHAGAVGPDLLGSSGRLVKAQLVANQLECGVVVRLGVAVGLLVGQLDEDAVAGGLELGEVDGAGGAESHDLEGGGLAGGGRGRDEASGQEGSEENSLDLHGDGCGGVVVVWCGSGDWWV